MTDVTVNFATPHPSAARGRYWNANPYHVGRSVRIETGKNNSKTPKIHPQHTREGRDARDAITGSRPTRDSEHFEGRLEPRPGGIGARLGGGGGGASRTETGDARGIIQGRGRDRSGGERDAIPRRDQEVHFDARNLLGKRQYPFEDGYK